MRNRNYHSYLNRYQINCIDPFPFKSNYIILFPSKNYHAKIAISVIFRYNTQFRTRVFVFQFFSVQGGNSTDVKMHSSEVKMYSAHVKIQVIIRNQQISI